MHVLAVWDRENPGVRLDEIAMGRIHEAVRRAHVELGSVPSTSIDLPFLTASAQGPLHLNVTLTRAHLTSPAASFGGAIAPAPSQMPAHATPQRAQVMALVTVAAMAALGMALAILMMLVL